MSRIDIQNQTRERPSDTAQEKEVDGMNFGDALSLLLTGKAFAIKRAEWTEYEEIRLIAPTTISTVNAPYLCLITNSFRIPWMPTYVEMCVCGDWKVVETTDPPTSERERIIRQAFEKHPRKQYELEEQYHNTDMSEQEFLTYLKTLLEEDE